MADVISNVGADVTNLNYVVKLPYNATASTGGDSLRDNLNVYYETGDIAWMLMSTALVLLMIPGVGLFYAGLARRGSALSLLFLSLLAAGVVSFQWFIWGYSLAFSHTAGKFFGNLENAAFKDVLAAPSVSARSIPDLLYAVYQGLFACVTTALAVGATAERGRLLPCLVFMFCWPTLIYDPIACSTWNPSGWSNMMGGLDFAGGTPVHIVSGSAALAYSLMLGERRGRHSRPHNVSMVVLGTVFLYVGWFGFNGGSAFGANLRAVLAITNTNLSAGVGGLTWCLVDYFNSRTWSCVGFCMGLISGLVSITPGAGLVPVWAAVIFGVMAGSLSNLATKLKHVLPIDDAMDIFAVHFISGLIGNLCTGFFAADYIAHLDGYTVIEGGAINGHWIQIAYQLADSVVGAVYSFFGTLILLFLIGKIPGLHLRIEAKHEDPAAGIDQAQMGEIITEFVESVNSDVTQFTRLEENLGLLADRIAAMVTTRVGKDKTHMGRVHSVSSTGQIPLKSFGS